MRAERIKQGAKRLLPVSLQRRLSLWPPVGFIRFGGLWRMTPISRVFGFDRGLCIDRHYIENFLACHATDIHGHVLEIAHDAYTHKFGRDRVAKSDVLHVWGNDSKATIVADLTRADHVASNTFDCIIFTQALPFIYEVKAVVETLHRILKPGGVLLGTLPGISQISRYDMDRWGDYWRFTDASVHRLFADLFGCENVTIETKGNVLVAIAFLHGLAAQELKPRELEYHDRDYQVLITLRAVKKTGNQCA